MANETRNNSLRFHPPAARFRPPPSPSSRRPVPLGTSGHIQKKIRGYKSMNRLVSPPTVTSFVNEPARPTLCEISVIAPRRDRDPRARRRRDLPFCSIIFSPRTRRAAFSSHSQTTGLAIKASVQPCAKATKERTEANKDWWSWLCIGLAGRFFQLAFKSSRRGSRRSRPRFHDVFVSRDGVGWSRHMVDQFDPNGERPFFLSAPVPDTRERRTSGRGCWL